MYKSIIFNLGRDALRYIVQKYKIKQLYIPYYLCDVIRHTLVKENCKPIFYHIDDNFYPVDSFNKSDYILYPNYFGICGKNVLKMVQKYPLTIIDNAHAYFDKPQGFACFNAGHKFNCKNSILWFKDNGEKTPDNLLNNSLKNTYKEQFLQLHSIYGKTNLLEIDTHSISFVYPYLAETTKEADNLVKNLKEKGKTVYRYWNPLPKSFNEYKFYSRLVPIPILPHQAD